MPNQPKIVETICVSCRGVFKTPAYNLRKGNGKYCSIDCRYAKSRKEVNCGFCDKKIIKKMSSKAKYSFCNQKCKYDAASDPRHSYITGPLAKDGKRTYRVRALRFLENECVRCGYNEHKFLLDVDHINGDRSNNTIENLQILCVTCHATKTRKPNIFYGE